MTSMSFFQELKADTVHSVYFFYGKEAYIKSKAMEALQKKLLMPGLESLNCTVLRAPSAQTIIETCETLPMMADYRVVIVRDFAAFEGRAKKSDEPKKKEDKPSDQDSQMLLEYLPRVPQTTCLILDAGESPNSQKKLVKTLMGMPGATAFEPLDGEDLAKWMNQQIHKQGKKMDRKTCEELTFMSGKDLTLLKNELEKLVAYTGERSIITIEDVKEVATQTASASVFIMVDAISAGKVQDVFAMLNTLLSNGESRFGILSLITRHYRQMLYVCEMGRERMATSIIAKETGVPAFAISKMQSQIRGYREDTLKNCVSLCVQADYDIKRGALREDVALDRLIVALMKARG